MDMPRKGLDPPFRQLIYGFFTNAWNQQELGKRTDDAAERKISGLAELVARANEIVGIDQRPFTHLVCGPIETQRVAGVNKPTARALKARGIAEHVQHDWAATSRIINLNVNEPFGRQSCVGQPLHERGILLDENPLSVALGDIDNFVEQPGGVLAVTFLELLDPAVHATEGNGLGLIVVKSQRGSDTGKEPPHTLIFGSLGVVTSLERLLKALAVFTDLLQRLAENLALIVVGRKG